jgi:hypothetical protein
MRYLTAGEVVRLHRLILEMGMKSGHRSMTKKI